MKHIVVTGGDGFIGRNLRIRLAELGHSAVASVTRHTEADALREALGQADFVFHLAGVNRPTDLAEFERSNVGFTKSICAVLATTGRRTAIAYTSSTQSALDNPYGRSKRAAEQVLDEYGRVTGGPVFMFRLPNVFGKWSRPNYNSVVATFCHNITRGLPITVHDPNAVLRLVYVDDVVEAMVRLLDGATSGIIGVEVKPTYDTTVGEVARVLQGFAESRRTLTMPPVGTGLTRALYATYLSYLDPSAFAYDVKRQADSRGVFVELLKTSDSGQFSYFTAHPGITRGEHYHHTKTEKFIVLKGKARFGFRHVVTNERYELTVDGGAARIVETVPGWAHNITNIGGEELVVMLWANEVFDPERPDTIVSKVNP